MGFLLSVINYKYLKINSHTAYLPDTESKMELWANKLRISRYKS